MLRKAKKIICICTMLLAFIIMNGNVKVYADDVTGSGTIDVHNDVVSNYNKYSVTEPPTDDTLSSTGYYFASYNVDINVNENNTFDIYENIWSCFNERRHGIVREIPLKETITREDGTSSANKVAVTKVSVNATKDISKVNNNLSIKIGDENITLVGMKQYRINYNYNIGEDPCEGYDEFYFNIIGNEWDTYINNVSFRITMPKEFDASKLGFSYGYEESVEYEGIDYVVEENVITGTLNRRLAPGEGVTVRIELPDGYFHGEPIKENSLVRNIYDYIPSASIGVSLICILIAFIIWFIFGRDGKVTTTVEFNPPEGVNSLYAGYIYKGKLENEDITSLLLYLASKGYIEIVEETSTSVISNATSCQLRKLKDYDGTDKNEAKFMEGLFEKGDVVDSNDLNNNFYITVGEINQNIRKEAKASTIFVKHPFSRKSIFVIMIIAILLIINSAAQITDEVFDAYHPVISIVTTIGNTFFFNLFIVIAIFMFNILVIRSKEISLKIFGIVWCSGFGGIPWCVSVLMPLVNNTRVIPAYLIGVGSMIAILVFMNLMTKRTAYGNELYGKILGFRNFLVKAEKDRLERMVMDNPTYFYDILPYAYVLGVSDKWISQFEGIIVSEPEWYSGSGNKINSYNHLMNQTMSKITKSMLSSPSSSSGGRHSSGGHSGGGHSSGGHGGGGGHSW